MAFKQPRVPEYRGTEKMEDYIHKLAQFLRDFCQEAWAASGQASKSIAQISYPVTSVNGKTGDVTLDAGDVGARPASWTPTAEQVGALASGGTAVNASKFGGNTWAQMLTAVYPVGAVYLSTSSTSPASLFGGTWEQIKDRFLLAAGGSYGAGSTGGAATHKLTESEMPSHRHVESFEVANDYPRPIGSNVSSAYTSSTAVSDGTYKYLTSFLGNKSASAEDPVYPLLTMSAGSGSSHNNMPPYLAVYMWKRVS